jgi:hypothetical protein
MATVWDPVRISTACLIAAGMVGAGSLLLMQGFAPQQPPQSDPSAAPASGSHHGRLPGRGDHFPAGNHAAHIPVAGPQRDSRHMAHPDCLRRRRAGHPAAVRRRVDARGRDRRQLRRLRATCAHARAGRGAHLETGRRVWAAIKTRSSGHAASVVITGFGDAKATGPVSRGQVAIQTSTDPVGAPLFYRDVPLVPQDAQGEKGIIKPLPDDSLIP